MSAVARVVLVLVVIALLGVSFLALEDITTGQEPSLALEYAWLGGSAVVFAVIGVGLLRRRRRP